MLSLMLLLGAIAASRPAVAANDVFDFDCGAYLEWREPIADEDRARAREILAWIALTHPIATLAMQRANDRSFLFDMVHLPTGFALPPVAKFGGAARAFSKTTNFELVLLFANWGPPTLASEAETAAGVLNAASKQARLTVTERIVARTAQLLRNLRPSNFGEGPAPERGRALRRDFDELAEKSWIRQSLKLRWDESFLADEIERLDELREAIKKPDVLKALVRELHSNLPRIIRAQRGLVDAIENVTTPGEFHAAHLDWTQGSDYAAIAHLAHDLPPEASGVKRVAVPLPLIFGTPPPEPPGPPPTEPSPPPPALTAPTTATAFDATSVDAFLDGATTVPTSTGLAAMPFLKTWTDLNRLGLVFTAGLGRLSKWRTEESDWAGWSDSASPTEEWSGRLNEMLADLNEHRTKEMDQLVLAEAAFERLDRWLVDLRGTFARFGDLSAEAQRLSPRDQRTLRAILDQIEALVVVSDGARFTIENRQALIFDANVAANHLTYLLGDFEARRLSSSKTPDLGPLREALRAIAAPAEEPSRED